MRAVVQRVSRAEVRVEDAVTGSIEEGLLVLLGVGSQDDEKDADYLAEKIVNLRVFQDSNDKMNLSLLDVQGGLLVVSQFTLYGDCRKGKRPSFSDAARPEEANRLYQYFVESIRSRYAIPVETGIFQADMAVSLVNDGPVTLMLDSKRLF